MHWVADMLGLTRGLEALFAEHQQGGVVHFVYRTELLHRKRLRRERA